MKHPHSITVGTFEFVHSMSTIVTPSFGTYSGLKQHGQFLLLVEWEQVRLRSASAMILRPGGMYMD